MRRLPRAAALAAAAASAANLVVYGLAAALWGVPGAYAPVFNPVAVVVSSVAAVAAAAVGLAVLARLTHRALPIFVAAAVALTLLSLAGPVQALTGTMPGLPAATPATAATMLVQHLVTGGIIAVLLPALARR